MLVDHEVGRTRMGEVNATIGPAKHCTRVAWAVPRMLTEEVVQAAKHLGDADKALIKAVYQRGIALKAIATIQGCSAGRLHHRLRMLVKRMRSPMFRLVLRQHENWPAERRAIAESVVLHGRSQREVAKELGVSLHRVRTEIEHLKALAGVHRVDEDA